MISKSRQFDDVDCVVYDLEDSVAPGKKVEARRNVCDFLLHGGGDGSGTRSEEGVRESAVRINSVGSVFAEDDLRAVVKY